ncbi:MAG TPA: YueI family protein [Firmicutes bacterium]|nr:YueI family protein [Bacillota bacterium]
MRGSKRSNELEKAVHVGIHGTPQLRPDEKRRYLGFFRERVIQAVTFEQIQTAEGMKVMEEALGDSRGVELVIHKRARTRAMPLVVQARKQGLDFTIVSNPNLQGDVAVLLVARDAVDVPVLYSEQA